MSCTTSGWVKAAAGSRGGCRGSCSAGVPAGGAARPAGAAGPARGSRWAWSAWGAWGGGACAPVSCSSPDNQQQAGIEAGSSLSEHKGWWLHIKTAGNSQRLIQLQGLNCKNSNLKSTTSFYRISPLENTQVKLIALFLSALTSISSFFCCCRLRKAQNHR